MADLFDNPMGTDGFEFVEYTAPDPRAAAHAVRAHGLPGRRAPPQQERHAAPAGRRQLHHQRRARQSSASASRSSTARRPARWRSASRTPRRHSSAPIELGARPVAEPRRADGTQHPGDRGHRRQPGLPGRPLRRPYDLRRRLRAGAERPPTCGRPGCRCIDHLTHNVHRGNMDKWAGFYEKLFNFREIRYFDIEGKKTGLFSRAMTSPCGKIRIPINEIAGRQVADRGIPARVPGRGHPAHRARDGRHLCDRGCAALPTASSSRTRPTPTTRASTSACRDTGKDLARTAGTPHPDRRQRPRRHAAADLHRPTSSARSSSRSSSARATRGSARAISARCSSRSSSTRNGVA